MWTLAFGHHEDRTPTHGYAESREAAMAAFAKSCLKCSAVHRMPCSRQRGITSSPLIITTSRQARDLYEGLSVDDEGEKKKKPMATRTVAHRAMQVRRPVRTRNPRGG
jgi:hypothetical protein